MRFFRYFNDKCLKFNYEKILEISHERTRCVL
nr:MAG TPA: hypothetical protein [Caudoviricetes sp.]